MLFKLKMSITSKTNTMNTQTDNTTELAALRILFETLRRDVDANTALLKNPKRSSKPKRSAEEIAEEKKRKEDAKAEKKEAAALAKETAKAAAKKLAEEAKAEKKEAAALAKEAAQAAKKLAEEAKAEKKEAAALAKETAQAAKGQTIDKSDHTIKVLNVYRDLKPADPTNRFKGKNKKWLRIAKKKEGSDLTVLRYQPENWTGEAIAHFNGLEEKWAKTGLPFSPEYVQSAKKKPGKKTANNKKSLPEKVVVEDTDEELCEEIPEGYQLYRRFLTGPKSCHTTWISASEYKEREAVEEGLVPRDEWAFMEDCGSSPFNNKIYTKSPYDEEEDSEDDLGKTILNAEGKVVGNCTSSFNPVEDDKKLAATVEEDSEEDSDDDLVPDVYDEFDDEGYKPFYNAQFQGETLKITRDGRVFRCEDDKFLGIYNEDTTTIDNNSSSEEDSDAFEGENDVLDAEIL